MSETTAKTKTKKVTKRERNSKKRVKNKYCSKCDQNITENEKRDMYMSHDTYHQLRTKEYCKDHEFSYGGHKCKPIWCDKCKYLIKYEIQVTPDE